MHIFEEFIWSIMNALEDFVGTMRLPVGKRLYRMLIFLVGVLVVSIVAGLLGIPIFVSWQEALTAVVIMCALCGTNSINKATVMEIKKRILNLERRK